MRRAHVLVALMLVQAASAQDGSGVRARGTLRMVPLVQCAERAAMASAPGSQNPPTSMGHPPVHLTENGPVSCLWQQGELRWSGRRHPHARPSAAREDGDSLALIASWECPGNILSGGQLQAGDLNNDGVRDLSYCSGCSIPDSSYIWEAETDDTFQLQLAFPNPHPPWIGTQLLCVGDGDADSLAEMVFGCGTAGVPRDLLFLESRQTGTYPDSVVLVLPEVNISVSHMRLGDLDGDGWREYVGASQGGGEAIVAIWENRGDNAYEQVYATHFGSSGVAGEIALGDFDGDGHGDVVVPWNVPGRLSRLHVIENDYNDSYREVWSIEVPTQNLYWVTPGPDLDRDGRGDFIATGGQGWGGDVWWSFLMYESTGDDQYELVWSHQVHSAMIDGGSVTGDIDGDGWPELLSQVPDRTMLFRPVGDNDLAVCWEHSGPVSGQGGRRIITRDLDGDSRGEAIWWVAYDPGVLVVYEWVGHLASVVPSREACLELSFACPFASGSRVVYGVGRRCDVTLEVTDVLGRRIEVLASGWHPPGSHVAHWDPRTPTAGVYFCRLSAAGSVTSKRLVLLK